MLCNNGLYYVPKNASQFNSFKVFQELVSLHPRKHIYRHGLPSPQQYVRDLRNCKNLQETARNLSSSARAEKRLYGNETAGTKS